VWLNTQLVGGGGCGGHVINSQSESHFTGTLQYNYRYITKGHTQNNVAGKGFIGEVNFHQKYNFFLHLANFALLQ